MDPIIKATSDTAPTCRDVLQPQPQQSLESMMETMHSAAKAGAGQVLGRGNPIVDDLAQDVVLRILARAGKQRSPRLQPVRSVRAYAWKSGFNGALSWLRSRERELPADPVMLDASAGTVPERDAAPGQAVSDQAVEVLRKAIGCLGEKDRQIIRLTVLEQEPCSVVAARIGQNPAACRARKRRALLKLRTLLTVDWQEDNGDLLKALRKVLLHTDTAEQVLKSLKA